MTKNRWAKRTDETHNRIADALRSQGALVQSLHGVGSGCPDLLVLWMGRLLLMEVKDGSKPPSGQQLTEEEAKWHERWKDAPLYVVNCERAAVEALRAHDRKLSEWNIDYLVEQLQQPCQQCGHVHTSFL